MRPDFRLALFAAIAGGYGCAQILASDDYRSGGAGGAAAGNVSQASGGGTDADSSGPNASSAGPTSSSASSTMATGTASSSAASSSAGTSSAGTSSSAGASSSASSGSGGGLPVTRRVLITEGAFLAAKLGSVVGANNYCAQEAKALGGTWKAWLSDGTTTQTCVNGPTYLRMDDKPVGTCSALKTGKLASPITVTATKLPPMNLGFFPNVWTGITAAGFSSGSNCLKWAGGGSGTVGVAAQTSGAWTDSVVKVCDNLIQAHLYCFEQP